MSNEEESDNLTFSLLVLADSHFIGCESFSSKFALQSRLGTVQRPCVAFLTLL